MDIAKGSVDSSELIAKIHLSTQTDLRRRLLLHAPFASTTYRRNTFMVRSVSIYNKLTCDLDVDLFATSKLQARYENNFFTSSSYSGTQT